MNARTWSARRDRGSGESSDPPEHDDDLPLDELLDARFDEEGRLAQIGRASQQRTADRLDPRPPALSPDELERAVQKLAEGLEAIERQSALPRAAGTRGAMSQSYETLQPNELPTSRDDGVEEEGLERLEERLRTLSRRLQQRTESEAAEARAAPARAALGDRSSPSADPTWDRDDDWRLPPATQRSDPGAPPSVPRRASSDAEMPAQSSAETKRQFAALEARIEALQHTLGDAQIEPVRRELLELLHRVEDVGRDGRSIAAAVGEVSVKLDQMETKLNAARNLTGNRLSELQDRLSGIADRIGGIEAEVPGFDALRENQSAILERFDRMEGLVQHIASPDEMLERVDGLRRHMQSIASQREVARIEEQIVTLAERLDGLPGDRDVLERVENQLQALAGEFAEARRQRSSGTAELNGQLAELSATLHQIGEAGRSPDLSGVEQKLADIGSRLDDERRSVGAALARLDGRLVALSVAVEKEEEDAAVEILAGLSQRFDSLAAAIEARDAPGIRNDLQSFGDKLDQLARSLDQQAERLSPRLEPLEAQLQGVQTLLQALSERAEASTGQFDHVAEKLREIAERGSGSAEAPDPVAARLAIIEERLTALTARGGPDARALQTQLEAVVSRLEVLKGRSIDPARINELFDRIDAAMRQELGSERFDKLEEMLGRAAVPSERFDRLEARLTETVPAISEGQLARLEEKIDALVGMPAVGVAASPAAGDGVTQEDFAELRTDIVALRRELRCLPGLGEGEANLGAVLKAISERLDKLPEERPATAPELERQIERLAQLFEEPSDRRLALAHIETSLKAIEARLEETRRALLSRSSADADSVSGAEIDAVTGLARALSDDVTHLKGAAEASEKRNKDAIEALQGTMEAVVKRMAFLERDAEPSRSAAAPAEPTPAERARPTEPAERVRATEPPARPIPARSDDDRPVAAALQPPVAAAMQPPSLRDSLRETPSGGLFSRLTSRELLKRATGGRADSFSPDMDESEETADLPLEPGTDSPIKSELAGAPSSDTAFMAGSRRGRATADGDIDTVRPAREAPEAIAGDDFLAAARRAAKEAAAEAALAEHEAQEARRSRGGLSRFLGAMRARRRVLLMAALLVALGFVVFQLMRDRIHLGDLAFARISSLIAETASVVLGDPSIALSRSPDSTLPVRAAADQDSRSAPTLGETRIGSSSKSAKPAPPAPASTASIGRPPAAPVAKPAETKAVATLGTARPPPATPVYTGAIQIPERESAAARPVIAAPQEQDSDSVLAMPPPPTSLPLEIGPAGLRAAALAGDPVAAFEVAARFAEGRGTEQDSAAAIQWYKQAAEAGLAPAQYRLGSIYEKGRGVPKDARAAAEWYRRAAEAGNVKAMHNLAVLHAEGASGAPDLTRAAELFREAARHGVRDSQFNLAILHARGLGVPADMVEAYKWFAIAASSGDAEALKRRDIIGDTLSEADLAKAKDAAAAFEPLPLITQANDVMLPEGGWSEDTTSLDGDSVGDTVTLVQKLLAERGYDPGPADGLLGWKTIEAISLFQEQAGLPRTGEVDSSLVAALQDRPT